MKDWPTCLDLFCKAGGTSVGYHQAGFRVTGVDIAPQKNFPLDFIQADALEYVMAHWHEYDFIAASPPCQKYSRLTASAPSQNEHPDLIAAVREALIYSGKPYVIENVVGAPLRNPIMLCGQMFGLMTFRHRLFESNIPLTAPEHEPHRLKAPKTSRVPKHGEVWSFYGHFSGVKEANLAMGIGWMTQAEMAQAVPPEYTRYIGRQIMNSSLEGKP